MRKRLRPDVTFEVQIGLCVLKASLSCSTLVHVYLLLALDSTVGLRSVFGVLVDGLFEKVTGAGSCVWTWSSILVLLFHACSLVGECTGLRCDFLARGLYLHLVRFHFALTAIVGGHSIVLGCSPTWLLSPNILLLLLVQLDLVLLEATLFLANQRQVVERVVLLTHLDSLVSQVPHRLRQVVLVK